MICVLTEREIQTIRHLADRLESRGLRAEGMALKALLRRGDGRGEVRASVAAELLHVTPQTIRNWVKRGSLRGRIDATGHLLVTLNALEPAIEIDAAVPLLADSEPDAGMDEILAEIAAHRAQREKAG